MKKLDTKSVKKILSAIASGDNLVDVSKTFGVSEITVGNIARGATHSNITGLTPENSGVKYLRDHKEKFVIAKATRTKKDAVPVTSDGSAEATTETPAVAPIASTTRKRKAKPSAPVAVTLEDRAKTLKDEATKIVAEMDNSVRMIDSDINARLMEIENLRQKQKDMTSTRQHWMNVLTTMNAETTNVLDS